MTAARFQLDALVSCQEVGADLRVWDMSATHNSEDESGVGWGCACLRVQGGLLLRDDTQRRQTASALQLPWSHRCRRPLILGGRKEAARAPPPAPCMTGLQLSW